MEWVRNNEGGPRDRAGKRGGGLPRGPGAAVLGDTKADGGEARKERGSLRRAFGRNTDLRGIPAGERDPPYPQHMCCLCSPRTEKYAIAIASSSSQHLHEKDFISPKHGFKIFERLDASTLW